VDAPEFKLDKGHQMPGGEVLLNSPVPRAILFLSGGGTIYGRTFEDIPVRKGDTVLIPAQVEGFIRFEDQTEYLTAWV